MGTRSTPSQSPQTTPRVPGFIQSTTTNPGVLSERRLSRSVSLQEGQHFPAISFLAGYLFLHEAQRFWGFSFACGLLLRVI